MQWNKSFKEGRRRFNFHGRSDELDKYQLYDYDYEDYETNNSQTPTWDQQMPNNFIENMLSGYGHKYGRKTNYKEEENQTLNLTNL